MNQPTINQNSVISLFGSINLLQPPTNIRVPEYLKKFIVTKSDPEVHRTNAAAYNHLLLNFGEDALKAKVAHIENYNLTKKATSKKSIPERLTFEEVAILMMSLYTFQNIQMTNRPDDIITAMYDAKKGIYVTSEQLLFERIDRIASDFKKKDMADVLDKIKRSIPSVQQTQDRNLYAVENGIYNKATQTLEPFNSECVFLTKIPVKYKMNPADPTITTPDGYKWHPDSWISDIMNNDPDSTTLIWQVIADCLQPHYSHHKSIWFYSNKGNNGKGTIGQLIKNLLGKGNYSSLSVADFNHEFLKETLLGSAANISDENDVDIYIDSIKDYKASVTGDDININRKYEKPLRIQLRSTNIQMMNGLPKTKDKSESFYRRLILVPFMKSFTNNGERKYIKENYIYQEKVLEYVLHKALNMDFDEYIIPAVSAELMDNYKESNNPVMEFWNEMKDEFKWDFLPTQFLFDIFVKWYHMTNPSGQPLGKQKFVEMLRSVIASQGDGWLDYTKGQKRVGATMDADEPLITEYGLDKPNKSGKLSDWSNSGYNGANMQVKRDFVRKDKYRGFEHI
ncbi:DNA primase family protein [Planococcus kocurii]|uniref:DNA primase family protein n=1 Tax=Planococcus kocurii TaxID=1374 RepID=UPI003D07D9E2